MAYTLQDSATYKLGDCQVTAGEVGYGWWWLFEKDDKPYELRRRWTVSPEGQIYKGDPELVKGVPLSYRALGEKTDFTLADLVFEKASPYKTLKPEKRESEFTQMMESLEQEKSDRAVAIVGAAYLDDRLARVLRAFFIADDKTPGGLLGKHGPLSAFGTRINLAYSLGFLDTNEYADLKKIQDLRNDFAHKSIGLDFNVQSVASRCDQLVTVKISSSPELFQSYNRRERFIMTVAEIVASLAEMEFRAMQERRQAPDPRPWRQWRKPQNIGEVSGSH